jgi:xanthine dehydrogenase molybdopterin-binding subunit B
MEMLGKRSPFQCDYRVGVDTEGQLQAVALDYYIDAGCSLNDAVRTANWALVRLSCTI